MSRPGLLGIHRPGPADWMTLVNAACGVTAILVVLSYGDRPAGDLVDSGVRAVTILLLLGTVFDTLDGLCARGGRGTPMGPILDSLADALSFGLAPAILLAAVGSSDASRLEQAVVGAGVIVYVAGALLRLADFSATRHEEERFTGLPSPLAAGLAVGLTFLTDNPLVIGIGGCVIGFLMVSRIGYPRQQGATIAVAMVAWIFGIAGSLGLYDVRIGASVILVTIGLVLPMLPLLGRRERAPVV